MGQLAVEINCEFPGEGAGEVVMGHVWLVMERRLGTQGREERDLGQMQKEMRGVLGKATDCLITVPTLVRTPQPGDPDPQPSMLQSNRSSC